MSTAEHRITGPYALSLALTVTHESLFKTSGKTDNIFRKTSGFSPAIFLAKSLVAFAVRLMAWIEHFWLFKTAYSWSKTLLAKVKSDSKSSCLLSRVQRISRDWVVSQSDSLFKELEIRPVIHWQNSVGGKRPIIFSITPLTLLFNAWQWIKYVTIHK